MRSFMNATEHYESTLELIQREAEMFLALKYGSEELELRMLRATVLKVGLFAANSLLQHKPRPAVDEPAPR